MDYYQFERLINHIDDIGEILSQIRSILVYLAVYHTLSTAIDRWWFKR